jgi:hypothetical protein
MFKHIHKNPRTKKKTTVPAITRPNGNSAPRILEDKALEAATRMARMISVKTMKQQQQQPQDAVVPSTPTVNPKGTRVHGLFISIPNVSTPKGLVESGLKFSIGSKST